MTKDAKGHFPFDDTSIILSFSTFSETTKIE